MSDKSYFEMNEVEANLDNMMNSLEFANYQIATGNIFSADEPRYKESIEKINALSTAISKQLCDAMYNLRESQKIINGSAEVFPEENEAEDLTEMEEVDYADAIPSLYGAKVTNIENIKIEGENGVLIEFDTVDGSRARLIYAMGSLYHVNGGEI